MFILFIDTREDLDKYTIATIKKCKRVEYKFKYKNNTLLERERESCTYQKFLGCKWKRNEALASMRSLSGKQLLLLPQFRCLFNLEFCFRTCISLFHYRRFGFWSNFELTIEAMIEQSCKQHPNSLKLLSNYTTHQKLRLWLNLDWIQYHCSLESTSCGSKPNVVISLTKQ